MIAKGSQMERLIEAAGGAKAENQRPSIYPTSGQMERLIAAMGGALAENQRPGRYPTSGQMERLIQAAGGAPAEDQLPGRYATSGQMERLIAAVGGEPAEDQVPGKYVTAGQMERLIQAIGSGGGEIVTVAGTTPLILTNALARDIRSLVQQGKVVLDGDNIVCNNGVLRLVHRSGLPSGYKLLEYVGSSGAAYVVTDVFLASTDVIEAEFRNSSTTGYGSLYGVFRLGDSSALYANQTYYGYDESNNKVDTNLRVNTGWHSSRHDFVNGTLTIDDTTVTFTPFEFANTTQNAVLARYYNNSYGYIWKGFVRKFKVTRGGEVICDLLPAKNEQDEVGLYDLISGTFYTATSGTLVAGDEVNDYELAVVGTPEVLTVSADGAETQTVTGIPDLFATLDGTVYDEVDLVSGVVTRRTEAVYENGAVVIRALATPVTEQTTPHELRSYAGDTTVSWTAAVSGTTKTVEYAQGETASNKVGTAKVGTAKAA